MALTTPRTRRRNRPRRRCRAALTEGNRDVAGWVMLPAARWPSACHVAGAVHACSFEVTSRRGRCSPSAGATSSPARSAPTRRQPGCGQGSTGTFLIGARSSSSLAFPLGVGAADLPRGVRHATGFDAADQGEHPQPRRRAVHRLRHPRASRSSSQLARASRAAAASISAGAHARDPRAADRDHHGDGGDPGRARRRSARRATASAPRGGRSSATTCCRTRRPGSSPARCSRSPGPSARRRRCCSSAPITGLLPETSLTGSFTSIPMLLDRCSRPLPDA